MHWSLKKKVADVEDASDDKKAKNGEVDTGNIGKLLQVEANGNEADDKGANNEEAGEREKICNMSNDGEDNLVFSQSDDKYQELGDQYSSDSDRLDCALNWLVKSLLVVVTVVLVALIPWLKIGYRQLRQAIHLSPP